MDAPFKVFETFGFQSGRTADKFAGFEEELPRSDNGLVFLPRFINAFMSLKVENYIDLGSHGMFICSVEEARVMSERETMTYTYYQNNVKPKPQTEGKKGFVCKVCGYIYEGDTLPTTSSARCASTARRILSRSGKKKRRGRATSPALPLQT